MSMIIYGASDDLVEVEGEAFTEEFTAETFDQEDGEPDGGVLGFSDGTILRIVYTHGIWRITPIVHGPLFDHIEQASEDEDDEDYSDRAYMKEGVTSVVFGTQYARAKREASR